MKSVVDRLLIIRYIIVDIIFTSGGTEVCVFFNYLQFQVSYKSSMN